MIPSLYVASDSLSLLAAGTYTGTAHCCMSPGPDASPCSLSVLRQLDLVFMRPKFIVVRVGPRR